jgi:DNA modification methylase
MSRSESPSPTPEQRLPHLIQIKQGDCRDVLKTLPDESVHCVVTSPPYWGLRDYGVSGQMGLESTPAEFVSGMVAVFREVRRVLRSDGTLWLNLGDSYNGYMANQRATSISANNQGARPKFESGRGRRTDTLKAKDMVGIPWRVALALQADGWCLRQDIIWAKPNPMPESVTDRCTKSHEYLFLLSKSERYYFDQEAILEPVAAASVERLSQPTLQQQAGSDRVPGKNNGPMKAVSRSGNKAKKWGNNEVTERGNGDGEVETQRGIPWEGAERNKRSVWTVTTQPFKDAHFATFPPDLIEPCILAGCPEGGTVLDPFGGAGTTGLVADRHGRNAVLIELNPQYAEMARKRIYNDAPLFAEVQ